MVDQIRFFATAARHLEGKSAGEYMRNMTSFIRRESIGVCAQVAPWNYPMMMAVWKFGPALAAGNAVVLKPSDTTPASTTLLAEIAAEFFPAGVFNVVCGDRDTGRAMVVHDIPAMVSVTGSVRAGQEVAAAAAAEPEARATSSSAARRPSWCSTTPTSPPPRRASRSPGTSTPARTALPPHACSPGHGVYDDFVAALAEQAKGTQTGMPDNEDVLFGPVNNSNQLAHVGGMVERAPDHANVAAGGNAVSGNGYFFEPTVISGLHQDDEMIQNEIFGPVITVQQFSDEDEAVGWANGVEYGLAIERVDEGLRSRDAHGEAPRLRLRVDQHPHPARRRDAPRRVQEVGLRQGPVGLRVRRLHPDQARHGEPGQLKRRAAF